MELLHALLRLALPSASQPDSQHAAAVGTSLRPHVSPLLVGLLSSVAHTAPSSAIEPCARLLHTIAAGFEDAWRAALPAAVAAVADALSSARREVAARAHELLLAGCLVRPLLAEEVFVALCSDYAMVTRAGMAHGALERYSK
jgi:hypothetical protein